MDDSKFRKARGVPPCARLHPDDGVDSRDLFRKQTRQRAGHADRRLCSEVFKVLSLLIDGGLGDRRLPALYVDSVEPAPDATRLLVSVRPGQAMPIHSQTAVLAELGRIRGLARCEVAAAIMRKRAPELIFRLVGPAGALAPPGPGTTPGKKEVGP